MKCLGRRAALGLAVIVVAGCTADDPAPTGEPAGSPATPAASSPSRALPSRTSSAASPSGSPDESSRPVHFSAARAAVDVRHLAGRIGPRLATRPSYQRAAAWVGRRFRELGYDVTRQSFPVPAGNSWGVPVDGGRSANVVATPPGFDRARPHRVVGAHLDTVAVAPGAEDNASGVAVVLELARLAAEEAPGLPTVFVAFGAEEPVGDGDALHHFGSRHYVATMSRPQRRALRAMASFDRVGVGQVVPVCTGPLSPHVVQRQVLRTAGRLGVPTTACGDNTTSDHWSFEKAGYPVVRFGSTPYAGYHSAADLPRVVAPGQLRRTGRLAWAWLSGRPQNR